MTKEEFERGYAERSGMTVERLHQLGQAAVPCDCDYEACEGWGMVDSTSAIYEEWKRNPSTSRPYEEFRAEAGLT